MEKQSQNTTSSLPMSPFFLSFFRPPGLLLAFPHLTEITLHLRLPKTCSIASRPHSPRCFARLCLTCSPKRPNVARVGRTCRSGRSQGKAARAGRHMTCNAVDHGSRVIPAPLASMHCQSSVLLPRLPAVAALVLGGIPSFTTPVCSWPFAPAPGPCCVVLSPWSSLDVLPGPLMSLSCFSLPLFSFSLFLFHLVLVPPAPRVLQRSHTSTPCFGPCLRQGQERRQLAARILFGFCLPSQCVTSLAFLLRVRPIPLGDLLFRPIQLLRAR